MSIRTQRSLLRTWVVVYAVLTRDRFLHCFSCAPGEEPSSATLRAEQVLSSSRVVYRLTDGLTDC